MGFINRAFCTYDPQSKLLSIFDKDIPDIYKGNFAVFCYYDATMQEMRTAVSRRKYAQLKNDELKCEHEVMFSVAGVNALFYTHTSAVAKQIGKTDVPYPIQLEDILDQQLSRAA